MFFVLLLVIAISISLLVSPLIAVLVFFVGVVGFFILYGMSGRGEETASGDPGSRAARRFRREARNTRIR